MTARCKFTVRTVTHVEGDGYRNVVLETRYDEALSKEDRAFSKSTPSGKIEVVIANPNVYDLFKPGTVVYVDVTPVEGAQ